MPWLFSKNGNHRTVFRLHVYLNGNTCYGIANTVGGKLCKITLQLKL